MKFARPTLLLLLSVLCAADAGPALPSVDEPVVTGASAPQDYAVVIGIEEYGFLPRVDYAQRDADAFAAFARSTRGIPSTRVVKLIGRISRAQILQALDGAGSATRAGGKVWVYFSGHGAADPRTAQRVLLPVETTQDTPGFQASGISTADIEARVTRGGGQMVLITDACFGGAGRDRSSLLPGGHLAVSINDRPPVGGSSWVATQANEVAGPLPVAQHGAFTYAVLGALRGWADGALDNVRDGTVTSEEADAFVGAALRELGVNDQRPRWDGAPMDLVQGKLEATPTLSRLVGASPAVVPEVVVPSGSGTTFGVSTSLEQALHDGECHAESLRLAEAAQRRRVEEQALRVRDSAARAWVDLAVAVPRFMKLPDAARGPAIANVEDFLRKARAAQAAVTAGFETVTPMSPAGCPSETVALKSLTEAVALAEVEKAEAALAALKEPFAVAGDGQGVITVAGAWSGAHGVKVVRIPAGTFTMGSPSTEAGRDSGEKQFTVTLSKELLMMSTEVTQGLYQTLVGSNPAWSASCGADCPVETVTWNEAVLFANMLSLKDGFRPAYSLSGDRVTWDRAANGWRLPTEAEWERAARGGQSTLYSGGNELAALGWFRANAGGTTHPVCRKTPNAYGLCDMSGNVWEWVWDWQGWYPGGSVSDPIGPLYGQWSGFDRTQRMNRGGGWGDDASRLRVAARGANDPVLHRGADVGFRLLRPLP